MNNRSRGFTLIEVLVVIGIFIILTTVVLSILLTVLRGTRNSDSIISVRQNGEYAMGQMVKELRFARSLDSPSSCSSTGTTVQSVQVTQIDLTQKTISCPASLNYPNFISANGSMLTNSNLGIIRSCYFVCTQISGGTTSISIFFSLQRVNTGGFLESNTTIPFQSSVTLRNVGS